MWSKIRTEKHKRNISKALKGKKCPWAKNNPQIFRKGHIPWDKNKKGLQKHTDDWKEQARIRNMGKKHTFESKIKMSKSAKIAQNRPEQKIKFLRNKYALGHKHTEEWKKKKSESQKGEGNWRWEGGITSLIMKVRGLPESKQWRSDIFRRDNWTCQTCHSRGYIEAHHIKSFSMIIKQSNIKTIEQAFSCKELWNITNGVTLCVECHKLIRRSHGN